jgi:hypothetical protein
VAKKRCIPCGGSGKVMGGGMMLVDCDHCDGHGKIIVVEPDYLAKDTESYKKAKDGIKKLDTNLSDSDAEKILDEEIEKQKTKTVKSKKKDK